MHRRRRRSGSLLERRNSVMVPSTWPPPSPGPPSPAASAWATRMRGRAAAGRRPLCGAASMPGAAAANAICVDTVAANEQRRPESDPDPGSSLHETSDGATWACRLPGQRVEKLTKRVNYYLEPEPAGNLGHDPVHQRRARLRRACGTQKHHRERRLRRRRAELGLGVATGQEQRAARRRAGSRGRSTERDRSTRRPTRSFRPRSCRGGSRRRSLPATCPAWSSEPTWTTR